MPHPRPIRLAFIGGWGHHYVRRALDDAPPGIQIEQPIAFAGDGHDDGKSQLMCQKLSAQWFDDAAKMLDEFRPDVVSIGCVYGYNGDHVAAALERGGIAVVSDKPIAARWE